jgi:hypothetical protein
MSVVKLERQQRDMPTFTPVSSFVCAGIDSDARAIPKLFWREGMTVGELETLAIVSIDYAHQEFPNLVGAGADILSIESNGQISEREVSADECGEIRKRFISKAREGL